MYNRSPRPLLHRWAVVLAVVALLIAMAVMPAEAHTTGPQLVSRFDRITPASPGVEYTILSTGSAPYVTVAVHGSHVFEIRGLQGEPFIRIGSGGVSVNRNSASLYLTKDPSKKPVSLPPLANQAPAWDKVSDQAVYNYYETRAEWPHVGQPEEARRLGRTATVYRFSIPASYDGERVAVEGHVSWVPAPLNLEVPLLFVPLVVVALLWLEPKAKPYARQLARATTIAALAGAALDGARIVLDLRTPGASGLAPLAVLPGLLLLAAVALPKLLKGDRRAYAWVMAFGVYLLVFGFLRPVLPASEWQALGSWLRRAEVVDGILVAAGAGLLLFLSSPVRHTTRPPSTRGANNRRIALD